EALAQQNRRTRSLRKLDILLTDPERLAHWILRNAHPASGQLRLPITKQSLAHLLSMAPENLSRTLGLLSDHGLAVTGPDLVVQDRDALEKFARASPLVDA